MPTHFPTLQGSLPNEHGALPPRAGPAEPTVTINTRAAFESINAMFGGGGNGARPQGAAGGDGRMALIKRQQKGVQDQPPHMGRCLDVILAFQA